MHNSWTQNGVGKAWDGVGVEWRGTKGGKIGTYIKY